MLTKGLSLCEVKGEAEMNCFLFFVVMGQACGGSSQCWHDVRCAKNGLSFVPIVTWRTASGAWRGTANSWCTAGRRDHRHSYCVELLEIRNKTEINMLV